MEKDGANRGAASPVSIASLRRVCIQWEVLRLVFNVVMLLQGGVWLYFLYLHAEQSGHLSCVSLRPEELRANILAAGLSANVLFSLPILVDICSGLFSGRLFPSWVRLLLSAGALIQGSFQLHLLGVKGWNHIADYGSKGFGL